MPSYHEIFIALRYLRARRKQVFVSVVTFFSIAGITVGVAALIVVLSVMNGFEQELREKVINANSHVVCMNYGGAIGNYQGVMEKIQKINGVVATSPVIYGQAMIKTRSGISGIMVRGMDVEKAARVVNIGKISDGVLSALNTSGRAQGFPAKQRGLPGIAIGKELAKMLGIKLHDTLSVISPEGVSTPMGTIPTAKNFVVVAVFTSGFYEYDTAVAYIDVAEAQSFFGLGAAVSGIEVRVADVYAAKDVADQIVANLSFPFYTRHWMEMNKNLFSALKTERVVMFIILSLIIIVAAFNIITSLIMVVMEKSRDIAILKSLGATAKSITRIFILQGIIIGCSGLLCGCALGILLAKNLNGLAQLLERLFGIKVFPGDIYYFSEIPVQTANGDIFIVVLGTLLICFLATIYPSRRAAKLDPVEALRYE